MATKLFARIGIVIGAVLATAFAGSAAPSARGGPVPTM